MLTTLHYKSADLIHIHGNSRLLVITKTRNKPGEQISKADIRSMRYLNN